MDSQWVSALANVIIALGVLVGIGQLIATKKQVELLTKQLKSDHERSRRERATELLQTWSLHLNRKAALARKLVETLNDEQTQKIFNQEQVKLDKTHLETVKGCLTESFYLNMPDISVGSDDFITLQDRDASDIRWLIICYLNLLETILVAWNNGIADKDIIESQFQYLVVPEKNHYILDKFRRAAGGIKAYPAIEAFVVEINKKNQSPKGKSELGSG